MGQFYLTINTYQFEVVGFVDNDVKKWNKKYCGIKIVGPERIKEIQYDIIIIAIERYEDAYNQLLYEEGVPSNKVMLFDEFLQEHKWTDGFNPWVFHNPPILNKSKFGLVSNNKEELSDYFIERITRFFRTYEIALQNNGKSIWNRGVGI